MRQSQTFFNRALARLIGLMLLVLPGLAAAHGYIESPPSRAYLCSRAMNERNQCGDNAATSEPQSIEVFKRYPGGRVPDGKLASGGISVFSVLDEQNATRWIKTPVKAGPFAFHWHLTTNHATTDFRYFMTKQDWNSAQPLSRASFEAKPFCTVQFGGKNPPVDTYHNCDIPKRTGYQVIFGTWDIADTAMEFYQVVDVDFGHSEEPPPINNWKSVGNIHPVQDLHPGDKVSAHVYNNEGDEETALKTVLPIHTAAEGKAAYWPLLLSSAINARNNGLKAGQMNADGSIVPALGHNIVYADKDQDIMDVEVAYDLQTDIAEPIKTQIAPVHHIRDGAASVDFKVTAAGKETYSVQATVIRQGIAYGEAHATIRHGTHAFSIEVRDPQEGAYTVDVTAKSEAGRTIAKAYPITLKKQGNDGDHHKYPPYQAGTNYQGGEIVSNHGALYRCKPWPHNGWCGQAPSHYEPGKGSDWTDAWDHYNP